LTATIKKHANAHPYSQRLECDLTRTAYDVWVENQVNDAVVKLLSTKMGITSGSQDFNDTIVNGKERNIKCSSSEIVDDDLRFAALLVKTVGDSGGTGFVNDTENVETSDCSYDLGGLRLTSRPKTSWMALCSGTKSSTTK
jgi:hypothetical protein